MASASNNTEDQEIRAELREKFLNVMESLKNSEATFRMHEKTVVKGKYDCYNPDGDYILVQHLKTPIGTLPKAMLRTTDVIAMEFDWSTTTNEKEKEEKTN